MRVLGSSVPNVARALLWARGILNHVDLKDDKYAIVKILLRMRGFRINGIMISLDLIKKTVESSSTNLIYMYIHFTAN